MKINNIQIKTIIFLFVFIMFVAAFYPVWSELIFSWSKSEEHSHGFLILPICFYIIFMKRKEIYSTPINPSIYGLFLTIGSLIIYFFSLISEITTLASVSMVFTIIGIILYLFGKDYLKVLYFPIFLLFLMIPIPSQIYSKLTIPLQLFVSKLSQSILYFIGIPIFREGNVIVTPQATLEVVQACSGLRSMISLIALSLVFGYFMLNSKFLAVMLSFLSIPITILMNIIRVSITVLALYVFKVDLTSDPAHTIYGMLIFFIAFTLIMLISKVLSRWDISKPENL